MRPGINYGIEVYWRDDSTAEWVVRRIGETIPFDELGDQFYPLGVRPNVTYSFIESSLQPGDSLVLYSDGISEAQNKNEEFFGEERTRGTISEGHAAGISAADICDRLLYSVGEFTGGMDQADDMTCVVVRVPRP